MADEKVNNNLVQRLIFLQVSFGIPIKALLRVSVQKTGKPSFLQRSCVSL